uniref:Uncharacterized protein n=1 Tax=Carcinus maenas virus 1 TaxID=2704945 RepID=A0A6G9HE69_9VIRU|nr:hypothetical protein [Carcinus maenas virus 1]
MGNMNLGEDDRILHISNPISNLLYNIQKYEGDDRIIIHKSGNGNWKQYLLTYITDYAYLHNIENMLHDNEYMLKYVEFMTNSKYKDNRGNVQYTVFIKDILTLCKTK